MMSRGMREATIREVSLASCTTTLMPMSARLTPSPIQRHDGTATTQALASQAIRGRSSSFFFAGATRQNEFAKHVAQNASLHRFAMLGMAKCGLAKKKPERSNSDAVFLLNVAVLIS